MAQKQTFDLPSARHKNLTFSAAVKVGNLVFVSGQGGHNRETGEIARDDIVAQTRQALKNVQEALAAAGASMDDVVKTVDYIVAEALPGYRHTADVRREFFKKGFPASTGIIVHRLLGREMLIEIEAIAVVE